ncbi:MAG: 50S ribosomal protein L13 [Chitinivibrionales bacterium]|nr:50S ribosomal protein L13 [Chitinivibrionales bacterium]MBD3394519.1 50S ribosomal protein L13 [Chitinivibrionales bacterium]
MRTTVVNTKDIARTWYVVDADDKVLGRLASTIASVLVGKGKPSYSPNQDHGDHVIVVNSEKVKLTGTKAETKTYFRHSKYPAGAKTRSYWEQMQLDPTAVVTHAVRGMVPKTTLGRRIMKKLHVYAGDSHPHAAQKPQPLPV